LIVSPSNANVFPKACSSEFHAVNNNRNEKQQKLWAHDVFEMKSYNNERILSPQCFYKLLSPGVDASFLLYCSGYENILVIDIT